MDLSEKTQNAKRHPWELARFKAVQKILLTYTNDGQKKYILDIGCGDAYISQGLVKNSKVQHIDCVDTELDEKQISRLSSITKNIIFHTNYLALNRYNLVLLLDVLEHIKDDAFFLKEIVSKYTEPNGHLLLTVPAFQALYSSHDQFLGHYRRYGINQMQRVIQNSNLEIIASGFLFLSLLPGRFLIKLFERSFPYTAKKNRGIGDWKRGPVLTSLLELFLRCDNNLLLILSKYGIKLPGLSVWILCKKSQ
jgi:SAM-dependent methyltransferase